MRRLLLAALPFLAGGQTTDWAYRPPARVLLPPVKNRAWVRNGVDAFLLAGMEQHGLKPVSPADRRALVRRVYLDLIGLPPTPAVVESFVKDPSPVAYERLVDRLLESRQYGERCARYWLDVVGYTDDWPNLWRYRDYVIRSFNQDKPFDQFLREQIAGDEYAPGSQDALIATGLLRLGDPAATVSRVLLGLTDLAREDRLRLEAVFAGVVAVDYPLARREEIERYEAEQSYVTEREKPFRAQLEELERPYRERLVALKRSMLPEYVQLALRTAPDQRSAGQRLTSQQVEQTLVPTSGEIVETMSIADRVKRTELAHEIARLEEQRPRPLAAAAGAGENGRTPPPTPVPPGAPAAVGGEEIDFPVPPPDVRSSWRRRALAEWLASPRNPLTARVILNRMWQSHFGAGIVRNPDNFGAAGDPPSHPELLDWLAIEFVKQGWSLKAMHRLLMTSNAYRMASDDEPENRKADAENRYWWRMPRQRLEPEVIRDSILSVTNTLSRQTGGPAVEAQWMDSSRAWRRSIYVWPRFTAEPLTLMNDGWVVLEARRFAGRIWAEAGRDISLEIGHAFRLALGRPPSATETAWATEFLRASPLGLVDLCQALFASNEFAYRP